MIHHLFQSRGNLPFLLFLLLTLSHCMPSFTVQPDAADEIIYEFGGGEMGAEWTTLTMRGDGHITYRFLHPYDGAWPQEETVIEHTLSAAETEMLFQSLADAGLFRLRNVSYGGVDVDTTKITAAVDGRTLQVSIEGTPDETIHTQITTLIAQIDNKQ